ncbi:hypothetical protein PTKU64_34970 [Paraburkholderia terrae]|uniref:Uncharacterized protein n=1 Tax=Paraburkholderia terrae TaxID=311230 RepID=A0ABN6JFU3_9BURK|nr:hypothetical protein PTKU64_34970 [Paraburkholderia terrae]
MRWRVIECLFPGGFSKPVQVAFQGRRRDGESILVQRLHDVGNARASSEALLDFGQDAAQPGCLRAGFDFVNGGAKRSGGLHRRIPVIILYSRCILIDVQMHPNIKIKRVNPRLTPF